MSLQDHTPNARRSRPLPLVGLGIAIAAALAMAAVSCWAYPDMAPRLVTRAAAGRHGESAVGRAFTAAALPIVTLLVALAVTWAPRFNPRVLEVHPTGQEVNPRNAARVLNIVISGLSLVLFVLHVSLISMFLGHALPVTALMTTAVGGLLVALGIAFPLTRPGGHFDHQGLERMRASGARAYRPAGYIVMTAGLLVMALAWIAPWAAMIVGIGGLIAALAVILTKTLMAK